MNLDGFLKKPIDKIIREIRYLQPRFVPMQNLGVIA